MAEQPNFSRSAEKLSDIEKNETVLFGVSVDNVDSHNKFKEQEQFGFSLLADTEFEVSKQYSGIMERFNASNRVTFIIDKAGYIRAIDKKVKVQTHGEDVVKLLKEVLPKIEVGQPAPISHRQGWHRKITPTQQVTR